MAEQSVFNKTVFDNGLTLLSERLSQFRSLSMGVWVKVGARHETSDVSGVCHFLEHMLFKGTQSRTALQIAREVDQVGGEFNAFTAREHTCFHLLLLDRDCHLGLDILSDVLLNSRFRKDEFERERRVILQEISMVEDAPEELAYDLFFEKVYGKRGLGSSILGSKQSVKKMKRNDLVDFFAQNYSPEGLIVSVAGDVSHADLTKKLRPMIRAPRGLRSNHSEVSGISLTSPPRFSNGFWWIERNIEQVHLIWGVLGPHYTSKDRFPAFLLNVYLGGGMSSALFQEIREKKGLAYTVYSTLSPFEDSGVFTVYVATAMAQVPLCLKLIEECVSRLKKKALSRSELRVIQDNLKGTVLLSSDCVESRMSSIAKNELFLNKYLSPEQICEEIDAVTPADVQRVAHQLFREEGRSILALGPKVSQTVEAQLRPLQMRKIGRV